MWLQVDYDSALTPFNDRFGFVANYYERDRPAIQLPPGSLVIDLSPVFEQNGPRFAAGEAAINAAALRAFVWLAEDEDLVALDWQHPPTATRQDARHSPTAAQPSLSSPTAITTRT